MVPVSASYFDTSLPTKTLNSHDATMKLQGSCACTQKKQVHLGDHLHNGSACVMTQLLSIRLQGIGSTES